MEIKSVEIVPVVANKGLVAFANVLTGDGLFLNSIGIYRRYDGNGFRLTYPTKKKGEDFCYVFHPTHKELSKKLEAAIFSRAERIL